MATDSDDNDGPQDERSAAEDAAADLLRPFGDRRWCALHTRARHEKKIAAVCQGLRVPCYLPVYPHRTFSGGKVHDFRLPMFPGYVFAALATHDWLPLKQTNSVAQRIDAPDQAALLADLGSIHRVERAQVELLMAPTLQRGQRVVVTRGPLAGVTGVVLRHKNRTRLQVAVEAIAQALIVDVERDALAPV